MPDRQTGKLLDPVYVPDALSYLAYGNARAEVRGLNSYPVALRPPVEVVYYAYHIMVGLGTVFVGLLGFGALLLWRKQLFAQRWYLWALLLAMPFPYIANEAGWTISEVGRQPWIVYGVMTTAQGVSTNVSAGRTIFTTLGFMGIYALLGLVFLSLMLRIVGQGPSWDLEQLKLDELAKIVEAEKDAKDKSEKDKSEKDKSEKDKSGKDKSGKDKSGKDKSGKDKQDGWAFAATSVLIGSLLGSAAAGLFPRLLPALGNHPAADLTIYNAASGNSSLVPALVMNLIGMTGVLVYTLYIYKFWSGKVQVSR